MKQVLHFRKIKTAVGLANVCSHNSREQIYNDDGKIIANDQITNKNFDITKSKKNIYSNFWKEGNILDYRKKLNSNLKRKPQKNASAGIEAIITASPDFKGSWNKYFSDSVRFLSKKFGEEQIMHIAIHYDEKTPHMHVLFNPIVEKKGVRKYTSSDFLGTRDDLRQLQTDFHDSVSLKYGLERGEEGSRASHDDIKDYDRKLKSFHKKELALKNQKKNIIEFAKITGKESFEFQVFKMKNRDLKTAYQTKINEVSAEFAEALKSQIKRAEEAESKVDTWENFTAEDFKALEHEFADYGVKNSKELKAKKAVKSKGRSR